MSEIVAGLPGRAPDHASNWRIRQVIARTRWQLVTFCGAAGGESVGVVDMIAIRKDHGKETRPNQDCRRLDLDDRGVRTD
jgi:hypothetical protein